MAKSPGKKPSRTAGNRGSRVKKSAPAKAAPKPARKPAPKIVARAAKVAKPVHRDKVAPPRAAKKAPSVAVPPPPAPAVEAFDPTKRMKNQAGLTPKELAYYRELLLAKRRELLGDVHSLETEALQNGPGVGNLSNLPDHMADQGTDNYEQEFTLGLMEKDRKVVREIDAALAKINNGTYGVCEGTNQPISKPRLEAQPWARYSIEHARKLESGIRG